MRAGAVVEIHICPDSGDPMEPVTEVEAVESRGLKGDRYFKEQGIWNLLDQNPNRKVKGASDVTFIELEAIEAIERDARINLERGAHRRNITTEGVPLNHLVGEEFTVGDVVCKGVMLCEPCGYMQSLAGEEGLSKSLVHRGGLNATVVKSGKITTNDQITW
jgi:MOSC domain-containing protein YiiM